MQSEPVNTTKKETIWSAAFVVLMVMNFLQCMAMYMSNTILPLYVDYLGAAASIIGVVIGVGGGMALATRPFAGPAFDSFPRKTMLAFSQAACGTAVLLYGLATSVDQILLIRLLHGIGMGGAGPLAMSLLSEQLPISKLASGMSIFAVSQSLAQVVGPAFGLWLSGVIGYSSVFTISGSTVIIVTSGLLLVPEKQRERPPYQFRLSRIVAYEALDKGFVLMMLQMSFCCIQTYLVLYSKLLGIDDISLYFVVYALCLVVTRPVYGNLADRFGSSKMLVFGIACFALSFILLSQVRDFMGFMIVAVVSSLGYGASQPLVQSLAMACVPLERRGAASNTTFLGLDAGILIGPAIAGFSIDRVLDITGNQLTAYSYVWLFMLIPIAIAFAVVVKWNIDRKRGR